MRSIHITASHYFTVGRLQRWLDVELSTSMLMLVIIFWKFALMLMAAGAIVFSAIMLRVLYQERKFGWMASFLAVVVLPTAGIYAGDIPNAIKTAIELVPLVLFYLYCFFLKLSIREWND